jgi:hypothetical protein
MYCEVRYSILDLALLGYYKELSCSSVPTFRGSLTVTSSRVKYSWTSLPLKMGAIGCPETSVQNDFLMLEGVTDRCPETSVQHNFLILECGTIGCPETSGQTYHLTMRNISEERGFHLHRGGSLKSRNSVLTF